MRKTSSLRRILMSTDCIGGVWTYSLQLARALAPYGIEVALASMGGALSAAQQAEASGLTNVSLFEGNYKLEWMASPWEDVARAGDWLLRLEDDLRPDVVQLNEYAHASLPWRSPLLVVGHSCVYSWFRDVRSCNPPGQWERYRASTCAGLRAAAGVTAPTWAMLRSLLDLYGPFHSCGAVYNAREASDFLPQEKEPFIFAAGRLWDEAKNTAALESAAAGLPWPTYIAGEVDHPDGGRRLVQNAIHLGQLSTEGMAQWMGRASIYVLPARYEPFGLTALEAGLAGCALVLGDIPTLREVWDDAAMYVPPESTDILASVLKELIRHRSLIDLLSRKARKRALRYTPERMARGYISLYEKIIGIGSRETLSKHGSFLKQKIRPDPDETPMPPPRAKNNGFYSPSRAERRAGGVTRAEI